MFRWLLTRTIEAAELLNRDADQIPMWQKVASNLAPLPTYGTPEGPVFTDVRGVNPIGVDYNWFAGVTPTLMADEINLDSDSEQIEMMVRTARMTRGRRNHNVFILLGDKKGYSPEQLINSRSGRIHLFPAIPDSATVGFRSLQARGGFEVSAECISGEIRYVEISSRRSIECKIMNPWEGQDIIVTDMKSEDTVPYTIDKSNGECIRFPTEKGCRYLVNKN